MQLIVLGMHRSGTSVLARLLNLMGAYFGAEGASTGANAENPKGFWERRDVRDLNDHVLHGAGFDWNRVLGFDADRLPPALVDQFVERAAALVLDMDAHRPWMLKEPRLCLLLPLWRKVLEAPVCIHIHRDPVEVAASLRARNAIPIDAGLALWERYVRAAYGASVGLPSVALSHRQLMQQPVQAVAQLLKRLRAIGEAGLQMPADAEIKAFVRSDLYRHKAMDDELRAYRSAPQVRLFERIERGELRPGGAIAEPMGTAGERALADYERGLPRPKKPSVSALAATAASKRKSQDFKELQRKLAEGDAALRKALDEQERLREALNRAENTGTQVRHELAERFDEIATLTRTLLERDEQIARLKNKHRVISRERDAARATTRQADTCARALQQQLESANRSAKRLAAKVGELGASAQSAQMRAIAAEERLAGLASSMSWRMTAPLRALVRVLRSDPAGDGERRAALKEIRASALFDAGWYLERNPDVAESGTDPAEHYLDHGASEGRAPGPAFDAARYLGRNPDVAATGTNPLLHYLRHGRSEGRPLHGHADETAR